MRDISLPGIAVWTAVDLSYQTYAELRVREEKDFPSYNLVVGERESVGEGERECVKQSECV